MAISHSIFTPFTMVYQVACTRLKSIATMTHIQIVVVAWWYILLAVTVTDPDNSLMPKPERWRGSTAKKTFTVANKMYIYAKVYSVDWVTTPVAFYIIRHPRKRGGGRGSLESRQLHVLCMSNYKITRTTTCNSLYNRQLRRSSFQLQSNRFLIPLKKHSEK